MFQREIIINTPKHRLRAEVYFKFANKDSFTVKKELFFDMCRKGCPNFDKKYSCPPVSPDFNSYVKEKEILVLLMKVNLSQLSEYNEYHKLKVGNAVLKPRAEKIMRALESEFSGKYLGTGACRLCKPCRKKIGKPCSHPDKMRFSLESLGVDCNKLSKDVFDIELEWYKEKKSPEYTAVICGFPVNKETNKKKLKDRVEKLISTV